MEMEKCHDINAGGITLRIVCPSFGKGARERRKGGRSVGEIRFYCGREEEEENGIRGERALMDVSRLNDGRRGGGAWRERIVFR